MVVLYHQTKTPIGFWCKRELNPRSLIQSLEILLVKLTATQVIYLGTIRPMSLSLHI